MNNFSVGSLFCFVLLSNASLSSKLIAPRPIRLNKEPNCVNERHGSLLHEASANQHGRVLVSKMLNYNTPNGLLAAKAKGGVRLIFSWNAFNKIKHSTGDVNKNQRATKHVLYIYLYIYFRHSFGRLRPFFTAK